MSYHRFEAQNRTFLCHVNSRLIRLLPVDTSRSPQPHTMAAHQITCAENIIDLKYLNMKRTHSNMVSTLTVLPDSLKGNKNVLKSTLEGSHCLQVTAVVDISKPADKPIDEIEEPEEEEKAVQNRLNKSNARMFQLQLEDSAKNQIRALETEMIPSLSSVKKNSVVTIQGPVEVRCGNIMLEARNVSKVEEFDSNDIDQAKRQDIEVTETLAQVKPEDIEKIKNIPLVDLEEDFDEEFDEDFDDDCVILE